MPAAVEQHHHRSTTKVSQKSYKSRFTSKNALKEKAKGKVEQFDRGQRRTPHQQTMSKLGRRNQAKQKRIASHLDHAKANNVFAGRDGAPRVVVVIPLCEDIIVDAAVKSLNQSLDISEDVASAGVSRVHVDRFKQKLAYVTVGRELITALDACRLADYVLFVLSAEQEVDDFGENLIRCIESQGVSNVYTVVQGLDGIEPAKKRTGVASSLKSFITHFFPAQEKVFSLDSHQECQNLVRSLCTTTPKGVRWREDRSWMLVEDVRWPISTSDISTNGDHEPTGEVILTGVVRGKNLKADRLVQVGDWGEFQIDQILAAPAEESRKGKANAMSVDTEKMTLDSATADQDTLDELAPEEAVMEDVDTIAPSVAASERKGVLLDDHHHFSEEEEEDEATLPRKLPKGTSKYQAAWYLGDVSDSESDYEDEEDFQGDVAMGDTAVPADGIEGFAPAGPETEAGPSEYPQSEMFVDPSPEDEAEDIAAYRKKRKDEAQEDLKFPDEIELHPEVLARERLARYRGLKSLRTSTWNTEEDKLYEPNEWSRLLEIGDYKGAKNRFLREGLIGGVTPGTRVHVHVRGVPLSLQQQYNPSHPLGLFSLLRHEHKRTVVNFSFTLDSEYLEPLKSKEELIVQCGPRRFVINPLFSQPGNTPNDVHKFERFVHPGRTAVASIIAPLTWGSVPALFFRRGGEAMEKDADDAVKDIDMSATPSQLVLVGHGTALPSSTSRVIAKRIVLTGEPFKINRRLVTIRYMFFNTEDVQWFKALSLWSNRGRQGVIKESLGTHGYFKAMFDGKLNMQEAVGVSLYKRVWPRTARTIAAGEL